MCDLLKDNVGTTSCWIEIENRSENAVLVRKYQRVDIFSEQRVFHPQEKGIISQGDAWDKPFTAKIYSIGEKMKKKRLFKVKVDKIYQVSIKEQQYSCKSVKPDNIDKQIVSYHRMEEVWDNCNFYETLRVPQTATTREIRVAYLKLAKEFHPDHNSNPNAALMFDRITEAYNTLSDPEIRKQYDTQLRVSGGALSKSYWRQVFCHWNRDKAAQVGISMLVTITGGAILLGSLAASPTGVGLPLSIAGGAIGGGLFAAGIGGMSKALSNEAALKENKNYKQWLKYSFWYGVAGVVAGAITGGIGGAVGPSLTSAGTVAAAGAVNGAVYGVCFQVTDGLVSERWIALAKRLRIDTIALDLALATITGASLGVVFHTALIASHTAATITNQARYGTRYFLGAGSFAAVKNEGKNLKLLDAPPGDKEEEGEEREEGEGGQLLLCAPPPPEEETSEKKEEEFIPPALEEMLEEDSAEVISEAIQLYDEIVNSTCVHVVRLLDQTKKARVRMTVDYMIPGPPENEADVNMVSETFQGSASFIIPPEATMIQVSFYRSVVGKNWKPIENSNNTPAIFSYEKPITRRFIVTGSNKQVRLSQIRDEYEQLVLL